jgi:hypothetical protein
VSPSLVARARPSRRALRYAGMAALGHGRKRGPVRTLVALRQNADSRLTARVSCPWSRRASLPVKVFGCRPAARGEPATGSAGRRSKTCREGNRGGWCEVGQQRLWGFEGVAWCGGAENPPADSTAQPRPCKPEAAPHLATLYRASGLVH